MMLDLSENVMAISTSAFQKKTRQIQLTVTNKVIAFDPGMRTFCTGYDPDGMIVEVGKSETCENYNTIFLPKFESQKMVFRSRRKINSKTARNMLTWSHYRFKTRLMNKAREYPNCRVIIWGEEYISQTCSECGYLHRKVGGAKKFKFPGCNQSDRNFKAARNILLKESNL
jgi:transposase